MKIAKLSCTILVSLTIFSSCRKANLNSTGQETTGLTDKKLSPAVITEKFETGTKTSYTTGNVTLSTGVWNFNDALLGTSSSDRKNGKQSARVRNSGMLTTNFNFTGGASTVTVKHAVFGSDAGGTWQLWYSTNSGTNYIEAGTTVTTSGTALLTASFTINVSGNIRFQIRKTDGSSNRINFDDFSVTSYSNTSIPVLTSVSPDTAVAGGAAFTITATGTNFTATSTINWNGVALATTFVNAAQLTASVPAIDIAAAGTAAITAATPGVGTSSAISFIIKAKTSGVKRFLFDATKAETAGNADWVIDEDNSTPQRVPTPAQSTVTSSTQETYWTGAVSSWGIALVKAGDYVETLPSTGAITYGNTSNPEDLSYYDVFVVDEPNIVFTSAEKTAILSFVQNGGGLFMISDHTQSDRNNDGWDSPAIWNDLMTNNTLQGNPFGFSIDLTNISELTSNVLTNKTGNPILTGSQGTVTQLQFNNGATITLQPSANNTVQGLIWQTGHTQGNTNVMCASSAFGSGRVFAVTDSSPMDDGTGASGNNLYISWPLYSHTQLFMNASLWLAKLQ